MRFLILAVTALILSNISAPAVAFEIELKVEFGDKDAPQVLRILSTSDVDFFAPTVLSYLEQDPETKIVYTVASSSQIMQAMLQDKSNFDLVISSAMDLQMKLVNDGYAQSHKSEITRASQWLKSRDRDEILLTLIESGDVTTGMRGSSTKQAMVYRMAHWGGPWRDASGRKIMQKEV